MDMNKKKTMEPECISVDLGKVMGSSDKYLTTRILVKFTRKSNFNLKQAGIIAARCGKRTMSDIDVDFECHCPRAWGRRLDFYFPIVQDMRRNSRL